MKDIDINERYLHQWIPPDVSVSNSLDYFVSVSVFVFVPVSVAEFPDSPVPGFPPDVSVSVSVSPGFPRIPGNCLDSHVSPGCSLLTLLETCHLFALIDLIDLIWLM